MTTTLNNTIVPDVASLRLGLASTTATTTATATTAKSNPRIPLPYPDSSLDQLAAPIARSLDEFVRPPANDPDELLKHRFLCKGGGMLLVGQTGTGKSSLAMQLMINWGLGQSVFGLEPARPIKSLLIQAENDDGEAELLRANQGKTAEAVLKFVPDQNLIAKDDLLKTCNLSGIGKNLAIKLTAELVEDGKLFESEVSRSGTRPKVLLSRQPVTIPANLTFDSILKNSQGHFIVPAPIEQPKKSL